MLDTAIGLSLYLGAIAFVLHGIKERRRKNLDTEPASPMSVAAGEIMRPILQIVTAYGAVKTTMMYYVLGGPKIFPLFDFIGAIALMLGYATWIQLSIKPVKDAKDDNIEPAPAPLPQTPAMPPIEFWLKPLPPTPAPRARVRELVD